MSFFAFRRHFIKKIILKPKYQLLFYFSSRRTLCRVLNFCMQSYIDPKDDCALQQELVQRSPQSPCLEDKSLCSNSHSNSRDVARKRDKTGSNNHTVFTISQQELSKRCMVDMYTSLWQTAQHREQ